MQSPDEVIHSSNGRLSEVVSATQLDAGFGLVTVLDRADFDKVVLPAMIVKRDGRQVTFDASRIEHAISQCFAALGRTPDTAIPELTMRVVNVLAAQRWPVTAEIVQDVVELTFQGAAEFAAARAYIAHQSQQKRTVPASRVRRRAGADTP